MFSTPGHNRFHLLYPWQLLPAAWLVSYSNQEYLQEEVGVEEVVAVVERAYCRSQDSIIYSRKLSFFNSGARHKPSS